jgi:MFS family permease
VLGYDASMMNALNILPSYTEYFHLTSATIALNSGIVWIGAIFGSIVLAKVPDIIGRKPSIFYSALVAILGSGIQTAAQNIAMFLVARFILGLGIGGTYVSVPLLIAETLPTKYRSLGLGAFTDLYYVGGLLSAGEHLKPFSPPPIRKNQLTFLPKASLTAPLKWLRPGLGGCHPSCRFSLLSSR